MGKDNTAPAPSLLWCFSTHVQWTRAEQFASSTRASYCWGDQFRLMNLVTQLQSRMGRKKIDAQNDKDVKSKLALRVMIWAQGVHKESVLTKLTTTTACNTQVDLLDAFFYHFLQCRNLQGSFMWLPTVMHLEYLCFQIHRDQFLPLDLVISDMIVMAFTWCNLDNKNASILKNWKAHRLYGDQCLFNISLSPSYYVVWNQMTWVYLSKS